MTRAFHLFLTDRRLENQAKMAVYAGDESFNSAKTMASMGDVSQASDAWQRSIRNASDSREESKRALLSDLDDDNDDDDGKHLIINGMFV
jgi:hypothetical protein